MGAIQEIFKTYGTDYIEKYKERMPYAHYKAISTIQDCRSSKHGINVYNCKSCKDVQIIYRACGSRNCPNCQKHKTDEWLQKRFEESVPGEHFMVTFTIPEDLRSFARSTQEIAYDAMFQASSEALRQLMADKKYIGCDLPGFFGVLHTWGRKLPYHPHIHYIVPGGGIDKKTETWKRAKDGFLVSVHALSKLYKGKLKAILKEKDLLKDIPSGVWRQNFVVDSRAVGKNSEKALKYLAPYVYKPAISDSRIISVKNDRVTFSYRKKGSQRHRKMTVSAFEFIRRFLQHVLPSGFMKVRYYGFMSPNCKIKTPAIRLMVEAAHNGELTPEKETPAVPDKPEKTDFCCPQCGGEMEFTQTVLRFEMIT